MSTVKLQGNDDKEPFDVDIQVAYLSELIKDLLNNLGHTEENKNVVVPLPNVGDAILRKVMEWAEHHKDDPVPTDDDQNRGRHTGDISPWDAECLKVDPQTLNDLTVHVFITFLAAYYLDVRGLLHLTCKAVGNIMKGKSPKEIREMFNINNDFTPAEERLIRKENELVKELYVAN